MSFSVTNSGASAYLIDGYSNYPINLVRGNQYVFQISATGHPFWVQTSAGSYNPANVYSTGITNNGTQNGTLTFNVPEDAPSTLYYVCQYHGSMGGVINITSAVPSAPTEVSATSLSSSSARVSFTASSGATSYTVTSSPGSITATGSSSPITINGLISGTSYTFTVTATGTGGTSAASSASSAITTSSNIFSMRSLFTNNAQVYYKPGSLSTGGGGSGVKNSRHKQRKT